MSSGSQKKFEPTPVVAGPAGGPKVAVCFSGGGIRACALAGGVLKHLVDKKEPMHVLSSVSGGGYLATAFQSWRLKRGDDFSIDEMLAHMEKNSSYLVDFAKGIPWGIWTICRAALVVLFNFAFSIALYLSPAYLCGILLTSWIALTKSWATFDATSDASNLTSCWDSVAEDDSSVFGNRGVSIVMDRLSGGDEACMDSFLLSPEYFRVLEAVLVLWGIAFVWQSLTRPSRLNTDERLLRWLGLDFMEASKATSTFVLYFLTLLGVVVACIWIPLVVPDHASIVGWTLMLYAGLQVLNYFSNALCGRTVIIWIITGLMPFCYVLLAAEWYVVVALFRVCLSDQHEHPGSRDHWAFCTSHVIGDDFPVAAAQGIHWCMILSLFFAPLITMNKNTLFMRTYEELLAKAFYCEHSKDSEPMIEDLSKLENPKSLIVATTNLVKTGYGSDNQLLTFSALGMEMVDPGDSRNMAEKETADILSNNLIPVDQLDVSLSDAMMSSGAAAAYATGEYDSIPALARWIAIFTGGNMGRWYKTPGKMVKGPLRSLKFNTGAMYWWLNFWCWFLLMGTVLLCDYNSIQNPPASDQADGSYASLYTASTLTLLWVLTIVLSFWQPFQKLLYDSFIIRQIQLILELQYAGTNNQFPPYSFISDGGHIDNTAIIPVLREKPDRIIALDSGDDPNENFGAFRKMLLLATPAEAGGRFGFIAKWETSSGEEITPEDLQDLQTKSGGFWERFLEDMHPNSDFPVEDPENSKLDRKCVCHLRGKYAGPSQGKGEEWVDLYYIRRRTIREEDARKTATHGVCCECCGSIAAKNSISKSLCGVCGYFPHHSTNFQCLTPFQFQKYVAQGERDAAETLAYMQATLGKPKTAKPSKAADAPDLSA